MDLMYFSTQTTNMFPMANSKMGGQLVTEYNLTSKESVMSAPSVEYKIGPSYVHSLRDFAVTTMQGSMSYFPNSSTYTDTALQIQAGRAIVNGYYVELLTPITIDLAKINKDIIDSGEGDPLVGELAIGLKTILANGGQTNDSILVEMTDPDAGTTYYGGLAVVILPADELIVPTDVINGVDYGKVENRADVTADIRLATFNYSNGNISNLIADPTVMQGIPAERIRDINTVMSDTYIRKTGLQPKRLYTFSGKGIDPETGLDTWCDSTDALMVWDNATPEFVSEIPQSERQAKFESTSSGVNLFIPHKQVDGMTDGSGNPQYFAPVRLPIPVANFGQGTPGIVNATYTQYVKDIIAKINNLYNLPNGKQKAFISRLENRDNLPPISQTGWTPGDYILVAADDTITSETNDTIGISSPSTIYVLLPPRVKEITNISQPESDGVQLAVVYVDAVTDNEPNLNPLDPTDDDIDRLWGPLSQYRGQGHDYLTLVYTTYPGDVRTTNTYYYQVSDTYHDMVWSDPIQLTGQLPFATSEMVGGFLNVDTAAIDAGYVYLDENGHLRLLDYGLLRTGVLAYQLGENFTVPSGLTYDEIQATLDEYVNERVAFPNANQIAKCEAEDTDPYLIYIHIPLPATDTDTRLYIRNIDSRFATAVNVVLSGEADSKVNVIFQNCQRLMVTYNFSSGNGPDMALVNCSLFYDKDIISRMAMMNNLSLWHKWYIQLTHTNPNLVVNGLTVSGAYPVSDSLSVEDVDYWTVDSPNDNHIQVKLRSLTFDTNGDIVGCGILVRNNSSENVQLGKHMVYDSFALPLTDIPVPLNRLKQPMFITGQYLTGYTSASPSGYIVSNTQFTIKTQPYTSSGEPKTNNVGEIVAIVDSYNLAAQTPIEIDAWDPSTYHLFNGSVNG